MQQRDGNFLKRNWRQIVNIVTIVAMLLLVYVLRDQIFETLKNVRNVKWWALLLMLPLQALNYDAYARMYGALLAHVGQKVGYKQLYRVTLELNFVNNAFPSGGVSGISFFGIRLRDYGVKAGTSTLIQFIKFVLVFVSLQVLIGFGLLALAIGGKTNNIMLLFAGVLATLTIIGTFLLAFIASDKRRIHVFFGLLTGPVNRLVRLFRPGKDVFSMERMVGFVDDIHDSFAQFRAKPGLLKKVLLLSLQANATELLTLYVVYVAFGEWVNIGAVIIAYAVANFAGMVSVLPGGVGIYEVLMTATLTAGGIPAALSIPVVVMYRMLSMLIQLGPGAFLYHRGMSQRRAE